MDDYTKVNISKTYCAFSIIIKKRQNFSVGTLSKKGQVKLSLLGVNENYLAVFVLDMLLRQILKSGLNQLISCFF